VSDGSRTSDCMDHNRAGFSKWAGLDSNQGPTDYEFAAPGGPGVCTSFVGLDRLGLLRLGMSKVQHDALACLGNIVRQVVSVSRNAERNADVSARGEVGPDPDPRPVGRAATDPVYGPREVPTTFSTPRLSSALAIGAG
jgi:hypothetical protein